MPVAVALSLLSLLALAAPASGAGTITQASPTSGNVVLGASTFQAQLATSGGSGSVTYTMTSSGTSCTVSSSGLISCSATPPFTLSSVGKYQLSGTDSDASGDSGTWSYTLYVTNLTQEPPGSTSETLPAVDSSPFSMQLSVSNGSPSPVSATFTVTGGDTADLSVSSTGLITASVAMTAATYGNGLVQYVPGTYTVHGTDGDSSGDFGFWTFTLIVSPYEEVQSSSTTSAVVSPAASASFTEQLLMIPAPPLGEAFTFTAQGPTGTPLTVSSTGEIGTTSALSPGTYEISGEAVNPQQNSGGPWAFTLTVVNPIAQQAPTTGTVDVAGSSAFRAQLTTNSPGTVTYFQSSGQHVSVSQSGAVSTQGTLPAGTYAVSGTDSDSNFNTGTWTFTLTVTPDALTQYGTTSATVADGLGYAGQLDMSGATGSLTYAPTAGDTSALTVSPSGAIGASSGVSSGTYALSSMKERPLSRLWRP
ncbi:MAG: hypothetical protein M0004_14375 [Actinomycetota bacterium]|nr:hypothetical protein [Actinomycetota bacterium]